MSLFYKSSDETRISGKPSFKSKQENSLFRDEYHDDVGRLVHSASYRRLVRKRQLLPDHHSDFVRNRLTHSNEVAQIATSIGNHVNNILKGMGRTDYWINSDLLVFSGLAHDIGHPPFGHLGEVALNRKMQDAGGFEGNAQTLRVVARLEQRLTSHDTQGKDGLYNPSLGRHGLNLTNRSVASILKYNTKIPIVGFDKRRLDRVRNRDEWQKKLQEAKRLEEKLNRAKTSDQRERTLEILEEMDAISEWRSEGEHPEPKVLKGFYEDDLPLVEQVHEAVFGSCFEPKEDTQSIECQIMDFADDIAYSIYDLEDCLKTGFITPERLMALTTKELSRMADEVVSKIWRSHKSGKVSDTLGKDLSKHKLAAFVTPEHLSEVLLEVLGVLFVGQKPPIGASGGIDYEYLSTFLRASRNLANDGKVRRKLADFHILHCCHSATIRLNEDVPAASTLCYPLTTHVRIEALKRLNFHLVISSDVIQADERRGEAIVSEVFDGLYLPCDEFKLEAEELTGYNLLPEDVREKLRVEFQRARPEILEIRRSLLKTDALLADLVRLNPIYRTFSLSRMVRVRDFNFRYSLAVSLYESFLRDDALYSSLHSALRSRRARIKRIVCDFIAGMTDRGLVEFHKRMQLEDNRNFVDQFGS